MMLNKAPLLTRVEGAMPTASEAVLYWAARQADHLTFRLLSGNDPIDELTYGDLNNRTEGVAQDLSNRAMPRDRALLLFTQSLDFVVAFIACQRACTDKTRQRRGC